MEYLLVKYCRARQVIVDGNPCGKTNTELQLPRGFHTIDLGDPQDYQPVSHRVDLKDTAPGAPQIVSFT